MSSEVSSKSKSKGKSKCAGVQECGSAWPCSLLPLPLLSRLSTLSTLEEQGKEVKRAMAAGEDLAAFVAAFFLLPETSKVRKAVQAAINKGKQEKHIKREIKHFLMGIKPQEHDLTDIVLRCHDNCPAAKAVAKEIAGRWPKSLQDKLMEKYQLLADPESVLSSTQRVSLQDGVARNARALVCILPSLNPEEQHIQPRLIEPFLSEAVVMDTRLNVALCLVQAIKGGPGKNDYFNKVQIPWLEKVFLDPASHICFCQALLIKLGEEELIENGANLLWEVFRRICSLSKMKLSVPDQLQASRCILKFTGLLSNLSSSEEFMAFCNDIEEISWTLVDHPVDSIRHSGKNALVKLLEVDKARNNGKEGEFCSSFLNHVSALPWSEKKKYVFLGAVAKALGTEAITQRNGSFAEEILRHAAQDLTISSHCHDLYETCLRKSDYKISSWLETWVHPLFSSLSSHGLARLQKLAMTLDPKALQVALDASEETWKTLDSSAVALSLKVSLVGIRLKKVNEGSNWKDYYLTLPAFQTAMHFFDDDVRIEAFETLVISRSSNELFSAEELEAASALIFSCIGMEKASRENFLIQMKKYFARLRVGLDASSRHNFNSDVEEILYHSFTGPLIAKIFPLLGYEDNSVRTTAIETLILFKRSFADVPDFISILTMSDAEPLKTFLMEDTYDKNRDSALALLKLFHPKSLGLKGSATWIAIKDSCMSVNPARSAATSHLLRLFLETEEARHFFKSKDRMSLNLAAIEELVRILQEQLNVAMTDLQKAACEGPMYGTLLCIRSVLEDLPKGSGTNACFQGAPMDSLLQTCFSVAKTIAPVLMSDTPEGLSLGNDDDGDAQKLLLCTWRSSKEISLILGTLIGLLPTKVKIFERPECLLSKNDVEAISAFYIGQLEKVTHRGAFEQAYVGFCTLCGFMWASEDTSFREKLLQLLQDTLNSVRSKDSTLCVTRRSAGVPFLIKAVVTTEPEVSHQSQVFSDTMETLLGCCEVPDPKHSEEDSMEVRVHAQNILRAMVRDNKLGDKIAPYLERTIGCALEGFKSANWAERNSATLLFSALVTRVFGVKRDSFEFSEKNNSLTTRVFFQRFPGLFAVFLEQLTQVSDLVTSGDIGSGALSPTEASLYPVLIMLAKLQPAPVSTASDEFKIECFAVPLLGLAGSSVLAIRQLSARAFVKLGLHRAKPIGDGEEEKVAQTFKRLFKGAGGGEKRRRKQNEIHGRLLLVNHILESNQFVLNQLCTTDVADLVAVVAENVLEIGSSPNRDSFMIKAAATEILLKDQILSRILQGGKTVFSPDLRNYLLVFSGDQKASSPWRPQHIRVATRLKMELAFAEEETEPAMATMKKTVASTDLDEVHGLLDMMSLEDNLLFFCALVKRLYDEEETTCPVLLERILDKIKILLPVLRNDDLQRKLGLKSLLLTLQNRAPVFLASYEAQNTYLHLCCSLIIGGYLTNEEYHSSVVFFAARLAEAASEPSETIASQEWRKELLLAGSNIKDLLLKGEDLLPFHLWHALLSFAYFEDEELKRQVLDVLRALDPEVISVLPSEVGRRLAEFAVKTNSTESIMAVNLLRAECNRKLKQNDGPDGEGSSESSAPIVFDRSSSQDLSSVRTAANELGKILTEVKQSGHDFVEPSLEMKNHFQKVLGVDFKDVIV